MEYSKLEGRQFWEVQVRIIFPVWNFRGTVTLPGAKTVDVQSEDWMEAMARIETDLVDFCSSDWEYGFQQLTTKGESPYIRKVKFDKADNTWKEIETDAPQT